MDIVDELLQYAASTGQHMIPSVTLVKAAKEIKQLRQQLSDPSNQNANSKPKRHRKV